MRFFPLFIAVALLCSSCQRSPRQGAPVAITHTDDLGHTVTLARAPQRIVSLAPSITETLFALGLDSSIAGVTEYCDYPPAARSKPRIGGIMNPNVELIIARHPDLVLMTGSGNMRADYDKLTAAGVTVFVSYPRTIDGIYKSITDVGALCARAGEADSLVRHLRSRQDSLIRQAAAQPKQSVLMLLSLHPIVAIGPGTFLDELITLANGDNIAHTATTSYPLLSREEILRRQPDALVATNDIVHSAGDILTAFPEWKTLEAVRQGRVRVVDASIVSRPGPRIIDGLEAVVRAIHDVH